MPQTVILGGGLSGLCSAYYLTRLLGPSHRVTVLEASQRFGGWIETIRRDDGITFETGPRSVRPVGHAGFLTLQMVEELGLSDSLVTVSKSHPAARNRFIYYPDRLSKAPTSLYTAARAACTPSSPFYGLLPYLAKEPFVPPLRPTATPLPYHKVQGHNTMDSIYHDETVDSFVRRRLGPQLAENVLSALVHGIYAGDTRQLSMRAIFPSLWNLEQQHGSIIKGLLASMRAKSTPEALEKEKVAESIPKLAQRMKDVSVYSFRNGLEEFPKALESYLRKQPNVELLPGTEVQSLDFEQPDAVRVRTKEGDLQVETVLSAISAKRLATLVDLPALDYNKSVTVGVVNLAFPEGFKLPVKGFGYLIPRSVARSQNRHHALGVIFDSDTFDLPGPTRVTVMMGGHYWGDKTLVPTKEELSQQAVATLHLHGLVPREVQPVATHVQLQKDCIPQYAVGHVDRMQALHRAALGGPYQGRLGMVGASYSGVGINDCVISTWRYAQTLAKTGRATGLEHVMSL